MEVCWLFYNRVAYAQRGASMKLNVIQQRLFEGKRDDKHDGV